jgi:hypothetical protein
MRRSVHSRRAPTSVGLLLVLAIPLALAGHVHAIDHDGATHHVEAPHGDHDLVLTGTHDRLPSPQLDRPPATPASTVPAPSVEDGEVREGPNRDGERPSARGPPGRPTSRAPPLPS